MNRKFQNCKINLQLPRQRVETVNKSTNEHQSPKPTYM